MPLLFRLHAIYNAHGVATEINLVPQINLTYKYFHFMLREITSLGAFKYFSEVYEYLSRAFIGTYGQ